MESDWPSSKLDGEAFERHFGAKLGYCGADLRAKQTRQTVRRQSDAMRESGQIERFVAQNLGGVFDARMNRAPPARRARAPINGVRFHQRVTQTGVEMIVGLGLVADFDNSCSRPAATPGASW